MDHVTAAVMVAMAQDLTTALAVDCTLIVILPTDTVCVTKTSESTMMVAALFVKSHVHQAVLPAVCLTTQTNVKLVPLDTTFPTSMVETVVPA